MVKNDFLCIYYLKFIMLLETVVTYFVSFRKFYHSIKMTTSPEPFSLEVQSHVCWPSSNAWGLMCCHVLLQYFLCMIFFPFIQYKYSDASPEFTHSFSNCVYFTIRFNEFFALLYFHITIFHWDLFLF